MAIVLAVVSAIANFLFIPLPVLVAAHHHLDVFVIWAVAAHGGAVREPL